MGRKQESLDTAIFLRSLQALGWFRNITDHFQIGIPDILGCYRGLHYGMEIKSVSCIPENGWAPLKKDHRFTPKQIEEMRSINKNGGRGIAIVICGPHLYYGSPEELNKHGQIDCNELFRRGQYIKKVSQGWDLRPFLDKLFSHTMT